MLIRKNTKAFKTIVQIVSACQSRADREQLIRLFITKAGTTVKDRIAVDAIQGDAALFYEMNFQTVLNSLRSSNHQLNETDEFPGVYFFHSTSNKQWDETPFEFDEAVNKEFGSLPDLPHVRKKEKVEKYVLPKPQAAAKAPSKKIKEVHAPKVKKATVQQVKQPDFKLKREIEFTDLDKIVFRQPLMTKRDVLNYYNTVSSYIVPYLEGRALWLSRNASRADQLVEATNQALFVDGEDDTPDWLQLHRAKDDTDRELVLGNDKEHMLLFVERGAWGFHASPTRMKQPGHPDYILITLDSPDSDIKKAADVALEIKVILDGLKLPSFIKTGGSSELHVYIPLDGKSTFDVSRDCAIFICKLIRLKIAELVSVVGIDDNSYGKVSLDYSRNEQGKSVVAPYSLVLADSVTVATPLLWDEVKALNENSFDPKSILKRINELPDPFENLFKKRINAAGLKRNLDTNYGFLF